jgi:hypothetical protein
MAVGGVWIDYGASHSDLLEGEPWECCTCCDIDGRSACNPRFRLRLTCFWQRECFLVWKIKGHWDDPICRIFATQGYTAVRNCSLYHRSPIWITVNHIYLHVHCITRQNYTPRQQISTAAILHSSLRPASWLGGQSSWILTMRSRVRFPVLPWEFSLAGGRSQQRPWSG